MANTVFMSKTGLTGGEATKLDSIDGATLTDNDAAFVNVANVQYIYRLDADSGAAESSPNIIAPDTNPGTKRWILQGLNGASLNMPGLTASLPVFTDGSKNLVSNTMTGTGKVVMDTSPTFSASATLSGLTASLPVFTDGSKNLVSGALLSTWFLQDLTYAVSNVTGDGTDYPLTGVTWTDCGQSPSGCFSGGTFTTSGSVGKYIFYGTIQLTGIGAGHTAATIRLSSGTYLCTFNPAALAVSGVVTISIISMESLNPSFPVYIRVMVGGSTKTVGIGGVAITRFGGLKIL